MVILVAALLSLAAAMVVLYPLLGLRRDPEARRVAELGDVAEHERAAKGALHEVEFDYRLGNLEAADYQALRSRYEERALSALRTRYGREQALDALIDRQLQALRANGGRMQAAVAEGASRAVPASSPQATPVAKPRATPARRRRGGGRG